MEVTEEFYVDLLINCNINIEADSAKVLETHKNAQIT